MQAFEFSSCILYLVNPSLDIQLIRKNCQHAFRLDIVGHEGLHGDQFFLNNFPPFYRGWPGSVSLCRMSDIRPDYPAYLAGYCRISSFYCRISCLIIRHCLIFGPTLLFTNSYHCTGQIPLNFLAKPFVNLGCGALKV